MTAVRRTFVLLAAVSAVLPACASLPLPGNRQLARQIVARKDAENTLVSTQGATCRVKADEFATVNVGDAHRCVWTFVDTNALAIGDSSTGPVQEQAPRRAPNRPAWP